MFRVSLFVVNVSLDLFLLDLEPTMNDVLLLLKSYPGFKNYFHSVSNF